MPAIIRSTRYYYVHCTYNEFYTYHDYNFHNVEYLNLDCTFYISTDTCFMQIKYLKRQIIKINFFVK